MLIQVTKTDEAYIIEAPADAKPDESFLLEVKFRMLAEQWKEEAKFYSFSHQYTQLDSYRSVLALGVPVLPLILAEIRRTPHPGWLLALETLTGKNPVPSAHRGDMLQMINDWLEWARTNQLT